jgi:hypothetical protein
MATTLSQPETFAESVRAIFADVRFRELELLNPVEELERAIADTLAMLPGDWPLPRGDLAP